MQTSSTAYSLLSRWVTVILISLASLPTAIAENCWSRVGLQYGIDPLLLVAIAKVESSLDPKAINHNRNGTYDIGLMQINSSNFAHLAEAGIKREKLSDPCTSIKAGAIVLAGFIDRHGYTWNAVGAYNAGSSPSRKLARKGYAVKVWREYKALQEDQDESKRLLSTWRRQQ